MSRPKLHETISPKPSIKVNFTDFWPDFDPYNFILYKLLIVKYDITISEQPDFLFYSVYGNKHSKFICTKILFITENIRPDFKACDYAFSFDYHSNPRNYRLPLYALYDDVKILLNKNISAEKILSSKKKFCCFIVSNPNCTIRNDFYENLSKYKHIDSGGALFNNIDGLVKNKREFIKDYKFVIAFENSSSPGYVTEKIFEPLLENCIPIYWGNPLIEKDFNTKSFINCHDFPCFDDVIKHVLQTDENDDRYRQYLNEPAFTNNELNEFVKNVNISSRLDEIIAYNNNIPFLFKKYQEFRPIYCFIKDQIKKIRNRLSHYISH